MKKTYHLFSPGRLSRKDNTLKFVAFDEEGNARKPRYLPIENISDLYVLGETDMNSKLLNFLGKKQVAVHFFDYYEHYTGSFMPKEYLLAGKMQIAQTSAYGNRKKRLLIAQKFVEGAAFNLAKNLAYYRNRGKDTEAEEQTIRELAKSIFDCEDIPDLMGLEGNIRKVYYSAFDHILKDFAMNGRSKQPPKNEVNALISFGNMMCYTKCLDAIYHTQLNPTISFLHEPGYRRYSLALDLAEIFKPILVDRVIFKAINKKMLQKKHFSRDFNRFLLNEAGKKVFIAAFEARLKETFKHRALNRYVSYKYLIRLECYKLGKHLLGMEPYQPLKMSW